MVQIVASGRRACTEQKHLLKRLPEHDIDIRHGSTRMAEIDEDW